MPSITNCNRTEPLIGNRAAGFAIIAALLAIWILAAVGVLIFTVSTQDIRISGRMLGEKKAFSAAEAGVQVLTLLDVTNAGLFPLPAPWIAVDPAEPSSQYSFNSKPATPQAGEGPAAITLKYYSAGGEQQWMGKTYIVKDVRGQNTNYGTQVAIDVGIAYGPIDPTTNYR